MRLRTWCSLGCAVSASAILKRLRQRQQTAAASSTDRTRTLSRTFGYPNAWVFSTRRLTGIVSRAITYPGGTRYAVVRWEDYHEGLGVLTLDFGRVGCLDSQLCRGRSSCDHCPWIIIYVCLCLRCQVLRRRPSSTPRARTTVAIRIWTAMPM